MNGGIGFLLGAAVGGAAAFVSTWKYWERLTVQGIRMSP